MPSFEAFSYTTIGPDGGEPWLYGRRIQPFGLDPFGEGRMPYGALLPRLQRFAVRTFSQDSALDFARFEAAVGREFFGDANARGPVADLLELLRIWTYESDWYWSSPLLDPDFFQQRSSRLKWSQSKLTEYDRNLASLKRIAAAHKNSPNTNALEMARLSEMIVNRWAGKTPTSTLPR
jgi:hypothetical protein